MKKGNSIEQFLQKCLENLRKEFTELRFDYEYGSVCGYYSGVFSRTCGVDGLMYIKEDLIIPQVSWLITININFPESSCAYMYMYIMKSTMMIHDIILPFLNPLHSVVHSIIPFMTLY